MFVETMQSFDGVSPEELTVGTIEPSDLSRKICYDNKFLLDSYTIHNSRIKFIKVHAVITIPLRVLNENLFHVDKLTYPRIALRLIFKLYVDSIGLIIC